MKDFLFVVIVFSCFQNLQSQYHNDDDDLRDYFSAISYLSGDALETTKINGVQYEILYRKPWTDNILEKYK